MARFVPNDLAKLLEPEAVAAWGDEDGLASVSASAAISLKRIADAVSSPDLGGSLHHQIENAAWAAGQAFERGRGAA